MTGPTQSLKSEKMPIGRGYAVSFSYLGGRLDCDWHPALPRPKTGRKLLPAYRLARNEFIRRIAERTGLKIMVVDA